MFTTEERFSAPAAGPADAPEQLPTTTHNAGIPAPDPTIISILSWKRPHASQGEVEFCAWLLKEIEDRGGKPEVAADALNCIIVEVPYVSQSDGSNLRPAALFSCHVDTVHHDDKGRQKLCYDPTLGQILLDTKDPSAGSCLGADDGAGIWLMLEMIREKVPGAYVFHRGEERGGLGAWAMLRARADWLKKFDFAIAFDRPDEYEVITHQGGKRCASDAFGKAVVDAMDEQGLTYELSAKGVFTDTKVYCSVIPECINLGVGYMFQHSKSEYLNWEFLLSLRDAVVKIDWDNLPVERDPSEADPVPQYGYGRYGSYLDDDHGFDWPAHGKGDTSKGGTGGTVKQFPAQRSMFDAADLQPEAPRRPAAAAPAASGTSVKEPTILEELDGVTIEEIRETVEAADPDALVDLIVNLIVEAEAYKSRYERARRLLGLG